MIRYFNSMTEVARELSRECGFNVDSCDAGEALPYALNGVTPEEWADAIEELKWERESNS